MIARLRSFFEVAGRFMGRFWLTVLYFTAILPFGVIARIRSHKAEAGWSRRPERPGDLAEARKQS